MVTITPSGLTGLESGSNKCRPSTINYCGILCYCFLYDKMSKFLMTLLMYYIMMQ